MPSIVWPASLGYECLQRFGDMGSEDVLTRVDGHDSSDGFNPAIDDFSCSRNRFEHFYGRSRRLYPREYSHKSLCTEKMIRMALERPYSGRLTCSMGKRPGTGYRNVGTLSSATRMVSRLRQSILAVNFKMTSLRKRTHRFGSEAWVGTRVL
jgi:hypothetical protein